MDFEPGTEVTARREAAVRRWFGMWLEGSCEGIEALFAPDAVYIESWGPEYHGLGTIAHWFREWNTRARVLRWDIGGFLHGAERTDVDWRFACELADGRVQSFEGVSLIRWDSEGRMRFLQEFGCREARYDPYEHGPEPVFRGEDALWF